MSTCGSSSEPSIYDDDGSEQSFPLERELEGLELIEDLMSDENLQRLAGSDDLSSVRSIELSFNSEEISIRDLGKRLPNLTELKLSNSSVLGIRDLGNGFDRLQVLWLSRASLRDLDGISAFSVIRELYLSYNDISDVSPVAGCDTLEVLDLEGNDIDDLSSIQFLSSCNLLTSLSLESNPVAMLPEYRSTVLSWLQQLQILDDIPRGEDTSQPSELRFDDGELKPLNTSSPSTSLDVSIVEELELVRQGIKHGRVGLDDSTFVLYSRATTSGGLRGRPSSASLISRPTSASLSRPATAKQRPLSAEMLNARPSTARPSTASRSSHYMSETVAEDTSSDLTFGGEVFCGNAVGALRKRKGGMVAASEAARSSGSPQKVANPSLSLFEELKKWKMETANLLINDEVVEPIVPGCIIGGSAAHVDRLLLDDEPITSAGSFGNAPAALPTTPTLPTPPRDGGRAFGTRDPRSDIFDPLSRMRKGIAQQGDLHL